MDGKEGGQQQYFNAIPAVDPVPVSEVLGLHEGMIFVSSRYSTYK